MGFFGDALAGMITGILTGFGIGGGTLLIIYLTMFRDFSQLSAQGINLIYFLPTAGTALISHIKNKRVIWQAVIYAGISGTVAAILAALIASKLDMSHLRRVFGIFLLFVGISELFAKNKEKHR